METNISNIKFRSPKYVFFLKKINNLLTKANDASDKFKDVAKCDEETFNKLVRDKLLNSNGRIFTIKNNKKAIINKL